MNFSYLCTIYYKLNTEITQKQMKQYFIIAINPDFNESPLINRAFCDENLQCKN